MPVKKEMIFLSEKPKKALFSRLFLWLLLSLFNDRLRLEATRRGGLRAISCQADKLPKRKDTPR